MSIPKARPRGSLRDGGYVGRTKPCWSNYLPSYNECPTQAIYLLKPKLSHSFTLLPPPPKVYDIDLLTALARDRDPTR